MEDTLYQTSFSTYTAAKQQNGDNFINPHSAALKQLIFKADMRDANRQLALRKIVSQSDVIISVLGIDSDEIKRIFAWSTSNSQKYTFRNQSYDIFYKFAVPKEFLPIQSDCDILFGLTFFTITLEGQRSKGCIMALTLSPSLMEEFHLDTGLKADVVFYLRDDIHAAVVKTLSETIPAQKYKDDEEKIIYD